MGGGEVGGGGGGRWGGEMGGEGGREEGGGGGLRMNHGGYGGESWRVRMNRGAFAWGEFHFVTA